MTITANAANSTHIFTVEAVGDGTYQSVFPEPLADHSCSHTSELEAVKYLVRIRDQIPGACNWHYGLSHRSIALLWANLGYVPVDDEDQIQHAWLIFPPGTHREVIWHWFEQQFDVSVAKLQSSQTPSNPCLPPRIYQFDPGPIGFIVRRQEGQLFNYREREFLVMADSPEDADRRLNALGKTLSIVRVDDDQL